jgi:DNA-binding IclR family transcriptional regulator
LRIPLLAAATGPFVLASWPVAERETFLRSHQLPRFTEHSITDAQRYLARVEEAARTGVSLDHEEYLVGVNAVAAPSYGAGGTLVALLWIVGFASRFRDEALDRAAQQWRTEAKEISHSLGARG